MSKKSLDASISRRGFLKAAGAAGALGLAGAGAMTTADGWLAPASAAAEPEEKVSYLYHRDHCGCHCSLKCTVRDGRVCFMEPNDAYPDPKYRRICAKGIAEIQHIYSADRIQTPLKRIGDRGEGKFESISWDEAYDILKPKIEDTWNAYGHEAVFVNCASEPRPMYPFLPAVLGAATQGAVGIDMGLGNGVDDAYGSSKGTTDSPGEYLQCGAGWNRPTNEPRDLINSKFILMVGNNVLTSVLCHGYKFFDAQDAGAHTVAVDPQYSLVASKCDEWVPIEPGTDAALYLGMASVIIDKKLYDEAFMKARTAFPFLVNRETGEQLTLGESVPEGKNHAGDYVVWDNSIQSAVRHNLAVDPALSGTFIIDGVSYQTVFDLFAESEKTYNVEWAAKKTAIPAEKITSIAEEYAKSGASAIVTGYGGNDKMSNADVVGHALVMLPALTGNIGKPGALIGSFADGFHGYAASLGSWKFPDGMKAATPKVKVFEMPRKESGIHAVIGVGDFVLNRMPNFNSSVEWIQGLDFFCAIDMYHTTYVDYADLVLPACTPFENEEPYAGLEAYGGHVLLREKALDPMFESKSDYRIQIEISELFGKREALPRTQEEYIRYCLDTSTDETIKGISLDTLVQHQGVQPQSCQETFRRSFVNRFGTPSEKLEVYYQKLLPYKLALPVWVAPNEIENEELKKRYPLKMCYYKSKLRVHNQFWDATWLNQYEEAHCEMNPFEMKSRNMSAGDEVRIFNDRGDCVTRVFPNDGVRTGSIRMFSGVWNRCFKSGGFQNLSNDHEEDRAAVLKMGPNIPFNDTLVEVERV